MLMEHTSSVSAGPVNLSDTTVNPAAVVSILGPSITRKEALDRIRKDADAYLSFSGFPKEEQEKILDFIQGNRGLPILYDSFFKGL